MKVLITRPAADAAGTAAALARRGHQATVAPVIEIRVLEAAIPQRPYQAVLATSANAMRVLGRSSAVGALRDVPLIAVGDASAEAAREAGFARVMSAKGAAVDLVRLVRARLDPAKGPLLFPSGKEVASDLATVLGDDGYDVVRVAVYEACPVAEMPAAVRRALHEGDVEVVLVYSPRSATLLGALAGRAGLGERLAAVPWVCLSPAVAEAARRSGAERVAIAERPEEEALFDAIEAVDLATAPPKRV